MGKTENAKNTAIPFPKSPYCYNIAVKSASRCQTPFTTTTTTNNPPQALFVEWANTKTKQEGKGISLALIPPPTEKETTKTPASHYIGVPAS